MGSKIRPANIFNIVVTSTVLCILHEAIYGTTVLDWSIRTFKCRLIQYYEEEYSDKLFFLSTGLL